MKNTRFFMVLVALGLIASVLVACGPQAAAPVVSRPNVSSPDSVDFALSAPNKDISPIGDGITITAPICDDMTLTQVFKYNFCGPIIFDVTTIGEKVVIYVRQAIDEELPAGSGASITTIVRVDWYVDGLFSQGPNDQQATVDICYNGWSQFSKPLVVRYYDEKETLTWVDLETSTVDQLVCAKMVNSGLYILAVKE